MIILVDVLAFPIGDSVLINQYPVIIARIQLEICRWKPALILGNQGDGEKRLYLIQEL
ncbi:MAG: hypothetical protein O3C20_23425 [Verrucomicrobia bacterium]|nr:hypothetical protein [Verrucomicrobiota bacterium]